MNLPVLGIATTVLDFDEHFSWSRFWNGSVFNVDFWSFANFGNFHGCVDDRELCEMEVVNYRLLMKHFRYLLLAVG